jgi:peroxiredoxin
MREGVAVAHYFLSVPPPEKAGELLGAVEKFLGGSHDGYSNQVVAARLFCHEADVCLMLLSRQPGDILELRSCLPALVGPLAFSYLSHTEVSEYAQGLPDRLRNERLYPVLPPEGMPYFCFYPMSKRRQHPYNWYLLPYLERKALMWGHGSVGREYRGRVLQLVTGSTGLDDHEWGVTLFGREMTDIKECVYAMRYDEASAKYAEFGQFFVGMTGELHDVLAGR